MRYVLAIAIGLALTIAMIWGTLAVADGADFAGSVPKAALAASEHMVDLIRYRRIDEARAAFDPLAGDVPPEALARMADLFPKNAPFKIRVIGWQTNWDKSTSGSSSRTVVQLRYGFEDGRAIVATVILVGDTNRASGLNFGLLTREQARMGEFHLGEASPGQISLLLLAVIVDAFAFATAVICLMGPLPRWRTRWLWAFACLFGLLRLNVVWTSGQVSLLPISFLIPPVTMQQIPIGTSWVFAFSIPLGAILYWYRRSTKWNRPPEDVAQGF